MGSQIIRFKLGDKCPNCGSWDLERVKRPFYARYFLFFLNLKTYWCRKCFTLISCIKKVDPQ